ncbi:MAG: DUF4384 domain-containing protein [Akkermansia sp.]|nr:DUF4384 domain-containing protein [Akkermansia sp.]
MPVILVTDSSGELHKYNLAPSETPYTLGRSAGCDIALPEELHLSRTHCLLTASETGVTMQDNNSSNGIYEGEARINNVQMVPEKKYRLGMCIVSLRAISTPPTPTPAHSTKSTSGRELGLPTDFNLKLRLLSPTGPLTVGSELRFGVTAEKAAYLYMVQYDSSGAATLLVPGCAGEDVRLFANMEMAFPRVYNNEYTLVIEPPTGTEIVIALACTAEQPFEKLWSHKLPRPNRNLTPGKLEKRLIASLSGAKKQWASAILHLQTTNDSPTAPPQLTRIKAKKMTRRNTMSLQ